MPNSYPTSADQKACSPHSPHPNGPALAIDREQQQSREAARGKKTACDPRRLVMYEYTPGNVLILAGKEVVDISDDGEVKVRDLRLEQQDNQAKKTTRRNSSKWSVCSD